MTGSKALVYNLLMRSLFQMGLSWEPLTRFSAQKHSDIAYTIRDVFCVLQTPINSYTLVFIKAKGGDSITNRHLSFLSVRIPQTSLP